MPEPRTPTLSALNSWKEIAAYLARGVRTVQRWERDLRLPVHRIGPGPRSPVCAFPSELDAWFQRTAAGKKSAATNGRHVENVIRPAREQAVAVSRVLLERSRQLVQQMVGTTYIHRGQAQSMQVALLRMQKLLETNRRLLYGHVPTLAKSSKPQPRKPKRKGAG